METHFRANRYNWVYTLSQAEMRTLLHGRSEEMVKYVYDGYKHKMGMKPIRKEEIRKKIQLEFHEANESKTQAKELVKRAVAYTKGLN